MFAANTRILVVDDMMTMRKIVKKCLKDIGYTNVQDAADGKLAWDIVAMGTTINAPIQLIISDWNMPNCSGLEFLKLVRGGGLKTPFIMLTAEAEAHQIKEALTAGVTSYILKPFTPESFKEKLELTHKKCA